MWASVVLWQTGIRPTNVKTAQEKVLSTSPDETLISRPPGVGAGPKCIFGLTCMSNWPVRCYRSETHPNCWLRHVRDYLRPKGNMFSCQTHLEHHSFLSLFPKSMIFAGFCGFFLIKASTQHSNTGRSQQNVFYRSPTTGTRLPAPKGLAGIIQTPLGVCFFCKKNVRQG